MTFLYLRSGFLFVFLILFSLTSEAQQAALLPAEDPAYALIDRLQRRGHLRELNPSLRPYTIGQITSALDHIPVTDLDGLTGEWVAQLQARFGNHDEDGLISRYSINPRLQQSSSRRMDVLRPLDDMPFVDPAVDFRGVWGWDRFAAATGFTFDMFYDRDRDGLDVVNRLFMRGEDAYLGFASPFFDIHIGRFSTHWSRLGQEAPMIGADVRQYDRITLRIGTDRISLRSMYGELDNLDRNGTFTGRGFQDGSTRRYIFAHRVDWRPHNRWTLSVLEGDLISGTNAGLSLKYLQPFHVVFFESDNDPKNFENNLMVGGALQYHGDRLVVSAQGILDDIVVRDRKKLKEEGVLEPTTWQFAAMATVSDVLPGVDFGLQAATVSALSYRTDQKEGQWTYAQRSLGSQFADYIHIRSFFDWYADALIPGLVLSPGADLLLQGTGNYRDDFNKYYEDGRLLPNVLSGLESKTLRPSLRVDYRTASYRLRQDKGLSGLEFGFVGDFGVNATWNDGHIRGAKSLTWQNTAQVRLKVLL